MLMAAEIVHCTSNSSAYPNIHTEGRAALEQKEVKKMSQRKDQKSTVQL